MSLERFPSNEVWQIFIPQNSNLTIEWGGREKQEQWAKLFLLALQRCDAWLADELKSLQDMYYFLSYERVKIARVLGHKIEYGVPRLSDSIRSPFTPNRLRTKTQYTEIKEKFLVMPKNNYGEVEYKILLNNKEKIALTLSFDPETEILYVDYPSVKILKKLMQEADAIWQDLFAYRNKLSISDKYFQLGKILWHLAIARPLEFGSASVSEALYYTLAKQIGLPLIALNCGNKTWDVWAMYHASPDEFAQWFSQIIIQSFDINTHFTLPALAMMDNTAAIENEAKIIYDKAKKANKYDDEERVIMPSYQTTHLVDPYRLGLFHHYHLILYKIAFDKAIHSIEPSSSYEKCMELSYKITPNGQVLFLDALKNVPDNIDPVIFKMGMIHDINFYEFETLKKETDRVIILDKIKNDLHLNYCSASNELKRKVLLSYFNYFISIFDNLEIKQLAQNTKNIIEAIPDDKDLFAELESYKADRNIIQLFNLFKIEKSYTDLQLMKLIEKADCMGVESYFKNFRVKDWLAPRVNSQCFLDKVLETSNIWLINNILGNVNPEYLETLMNYVVRKNNHEQTTFLFYHLFENFSLDILNTHVKPWLAKHSDINLTALLLGNARPLTKSLKNLIPILSPSISLEKINQIKIEDVLSILNIKNKAAAVDFFAERGMNLTLPAIIDKELIDHIQSYIYFSDNINTCRQFCQQLGPKMIKNILMIDANNLSWYFDNNENSIINFCKILNELTNSAKDYNPILFAAKPPKEAYQQAVFKGIFTYMSHSPFIKFDILEIYFNHLDFFTQENLQACKDILVKNRWKYKDMENKTDNIIAIIDSRIKALVVKPC